ncbi:hypothetical protein IWQ60_001711 [Tieghemiomyces parasiticus]|uniref:Ribosomal eL28/Mak16 domain-containing protein n=1 Tax=Tieghemiomyces parasiticus TaxID=78921 RepID=A0A9W8A8P7_9FUNG|nr:hypothetical protein IWQ60_004278 [Tieghemiomyces parasiticus]KAJ1928808.1 hypothetical protein IWQ60_001711 [Tieghemiomyces parasiticus]
MSSDLVWLAVRDNNAFKFKNHGVTFSREAGNLRNIPSPRYSGLTGAPTVFIESAGEQGYNVIVPKSNVHERSVQRTETIQVAKGSSPAETVQAVQKVLESHKIRPDLHSAALARITALAQADARQA